MTSSTSEGEAQERAMEGHSPLDGAPLEPVTQTPASELGAIVERARSAARTHAERDLETRARLLERFRDALLARGDELARTLHREIGKPEAEAWVHEILPTADLARFWSSDGRSHLASYEPDLDAVAYPGKRAVVEHLPRGVIGVITPWNFPLALALRTLFPALLAGNGAVLKPSEHAPRVGALVGVAAREVFGGDLVAVAQGGRDVGEALVGAGIDAVAFTGSVSGGRAVAHAAAEALIPVSLELGGKDPAVVLEDADLERTARGLVWGALANAGQNCAAIERVYAVSKIAKPLRERIATHVARLAPERDYGPVITDAQQRVIEDHVAEARRAGAAIDTGGELLARDGRWYAPTVIADPPPESRVLTEETFGPVLPVVTVDDERAAIEAANTSRYGLTASVWTRDVTRGERVARQLGAGVVVVNNHGFTGAIPALPWSGVGDSGYGVTNSPQALPLLTRPRTFVVDARRAKRELWWYPYTPALVALARSLATLRRRGAGLVAKIKALANALRARLTRWRE